MKRSFLVSIAALFACVAACAQAPFIPVLASSCLYTGHTLIAKGQLTVQAVYADGSPIGFKIGGGGLETVDGTPVPIVNGSIVGSLQIPNPAVTDPAGVGYTFTISNSVTYSRTVFAKVAITSEMLDGSGNFNLCSLPGSAWATAAPVVYVAGPAGPTGPQGPPGSGSGGSVTTFAAVPTGAVNGSNTAFVVPSAPTLLFFYVNGIFEQPGVDLTFSGTTATLAAAPLSVDKVFAIGITITGGTGTLSQVPSGTVNGSNVTFTLTSAPSQLWLYDNGILLQPGGLDYTLSGSTITFTVAPQIGDLLYAQGIL